MSGDAGPSLEQIPLARIVELVERLDVRGPRYTSYPTVPAWRGDFPPEPFARALGALAANRRPVAVYVHLPFCRSRCLYCGCNSFVTGRTNRMRRYVDALKREIDGVAAALGASVTHRHLHLGGGTPTHLPPALLAELLGHLLARIAGTEDAERSVEVDPRITTDEHLELLAARGFRRLSAGVQDVDPRVQQAVRREYSPTALADFVARARAAGFTGINLDLIYGLPRQTPATWLATLEAMVALGPDRLACFGYAHLPSRLKHQRGLNEKQLPSPRQRLVMLIAANRYFTSHGYEAIGMDHFARPADELARARREGRLWRNFMGYTETRGLELIGLGCSAISELESLFVQNEVAPEAYAEHIEAGRSPIVRGHELDADDRYRKQLINHLMCNLEIHPPAPEQWDDTRSWAALQDKLELLAPFEKEGLLVPADDGYRVTPLGQLFVRNLAMVFDRYLPRQTAGAFSRTV